MAEKNVKTLEPPPGEGSFVGIDENVLHIITDGKAEGFYHASAIAKKVKEDIRMSSYNFRVEYHTKSSVFISEYIKAGKQDLPLFEKKDVINQSFLKKIGTGDIIIASGSNAFGNEKLLKGLKELVSQNDESFFYFGSTSQVKNFKKEQFDFDLFALTHDSLKEEERDDDDIIAISNNAVFDISFQAETQNHKKPEKDYLFVSLPFLNTRRKQEIRTFRKTKSSSFGLANLLLSIKTAYESGTKIALISNLVNEVDYETEFALRNLIQNSINSKDDIKIKFVHQDYIKSNKIPDAFSHLIANEKDKIIFPSSHSSEIFSFLNGGINPENIFWFKDEEEEDEEGGSAILNLPFGRINRHIFNTFQKFSKFSEKEKILLRQYKAQIIYNEIYCAYIANEIVIAYTEDTQNKSQENEVAEEPIIEEELEHLETETEVEADEEVELEEELEASEIPETAFSNEGAELDFDPDISNFTSINDEDLENFTVVNVTEMPEEAEEHSLDTEDLKDDLDIDLDIEFDENPDIKEKTEIENPKPDVPETQKPSFAEALANSREITGSGLER